MTLWDVQFGRGKVNVVAQDASDGRGDVPLTNHTGMLRKQPPRRRAPDNQPRAGEAGLAWIRQYLANYDLSLIQAIRIERGRSKKAVGVYGKCFFPTKDNPLYRVTCMIPGPFPCKIVIRKPPLYMNQDRSYPTTPPGQRKGLECLDKRTGRRWYRMIGLTELNDLDEAIVWIMAHEAFHYLRRTKQIPGRNNEIQADAYGDELMSHFQNQRTTLIEQLQAGQSQQTLSDDIARPISPMVVKRAAPKRAVKKKNTRKPKMTLPVTTSKATKANPPKTKPVPEPVALPTSSLIKTVATWMGLWAQPPARKKVR